MNRHDNKSCPCKYISWNLSSNTAAEYGDLKALSHRITQTNDRGESHSEPLHLAAQHGHVSVTSYLLNNGYNADSGSRITSMKPNEHNSTPLHRACYSGAIGCVKLLLDHNANLSNTLLNVSDSVDKFTKRLCYIVEQVPEDGTWRTLMRGEKTLS